MASRRLDQFPIGLYAHWLDGEWLKIAYPIAVEGRYSTLAEIAQGGLKLHALFGTRVAISDIQLTDSEAIVRAFANPEFRTYLNADPTFLTLISSPPNGVSDTDLARATSGLYRACSQPHWRTSLFGISETVIKHFGDEILSSGDILPERHLRNSRKSSRRTMGDPEGTLLEGMLYGIHFFARGRGRISTQPNTSRSYIDWMVQFLNTKGLSDEHYNAFESIYKSVGEWVPDESRRYARSSLNTALESKEPNRNKWPWEYHRLWRTVVHAWNSNVSENLGTKRSSILPLPYALVGDRSRITDAAGPFSISKSLVRNRFGSSLLAFDPTSLSWAAIRQIVKENRSLCGRLQKAIVGRKPDETDDARSALIEKLNLQLAPTLERKVPAPWYLAAHAAALYLCPALEPAIIVLEAADEGQVHLRTKLAKRAVFNTLRNFSEELVP